MGSLADDLHDVVSLAFVLEVVVDEFERVTEGGDGGKADLDIGLFFAGTLNDGRENGIRVAGEGKSEFLVLALANVTNGGERRLFLLVGALANVLDEEGQQVVPLTTGQLDGSNGRYDLSSSVASADVGRGEGLQGELLDAVLGVVVCVLEPFCLQLLMAGKVSGCEGVFEGETGGGTDGTIGLVVCKFLDEGREVERL